MIRYLALLLLYIPIQLLTYIITPLLPLFAELRDGPADNANSESYDFRLPLWLSWFDTPDNSLCGDAGWQRSHSDSYLDMVAWLYRNSLYGFKWSVLSMPIQVAEREVAGNLAINHHTKTYGHFFILQDNGAWQYKLVKPMLGKILVLNLGWLLDDTEQPRALFMFSPRLKKV